MTKTKIKELADETAYLILDTLIAYPLSSESQRCDGEGYPYYGRGTPIVLSDADELEKFKSECFSVIGENVFNSLTVAKPGSQSIYNGCIEDYCSKQLNKALYNILKDRPKDIYQLLRNNLDAADYSGFDFMEILDDLKKTFSIEP